MEGRFCWRSTEWRCTKFNPSATAGAAHRSYRQRYKTLIDPESWWHAVRIFLDFGNILPFLKKIVSIKRENLLFRNSKSGAFCPYFGKMLHFHLCSTDFHRNSHVKKQVYCSQNQLSIRVAYLAMKVLPMHLTFQNKPGSLLPRWCSAESHIPVPPYTWALPGLRQRQ